MIDNKSGTFKFLEQVLFETNQKHAMRMYFFISAWRRYPATCVRSVDWVRKWLRLENKYPRWDMFYSSVLKKAEDELYRIAVVEGKGDLYFTTKKIYKPGESEVGEPSSLQFIIHRSAAGEAYDETSEFKAQRTTVGFKLFFVPATAFIGEKTQLVAPSGGNDYGFAFRQTLVPAFTLTDILGIDSELPRTAKIDHNSFFVFCKQSIHIDVLSSKKLAKRSDSL
jgi:hypothetical protein